MHEEIVQTREEIGRREAEIYGFSRDCGQKSDAANCLKRDLDGMIHELADLKDEMCRDADEIHRLRDLNAIKEDDNAVTANRIKALEY